MSTIIDKALGALGLGSRPRVEAGQTAPDFVLDDSEGRPVSLAALRAEGPVVLAFFPRAFTGGCTRELRTFRDHHQELTGRGARLVAISVDDGPSLARFKTSLAAPFTFLSDPDGRVARLYGGVSAGTANRVTVTIGADGVITRVTSGLSALFPAADIAACPAAGD
jgi:peroxiredoxin